MELMKMSKEEIELLSYTDITYLILKEEKISMTTPAIFKKICELLEYSDEDFVNQIGDYYTSLTIDKRFLLLDNNEWDLRERHAVNIIVDDEEEEEETVDEEEIDEEENVDEEEEEETVDEEEIDDDDDLEDLEIIPEEELEGN
ncbi:MAG: DNA-directed RNA polymerase subunit delta [Bacilli bacterium]|nr:DNA-directed RNA polymerase subunit delta [Bacilli bacterium]